MKCQTYLEISIIIKLYCSSQEPESNIFPKHNLIHNMDGSLDLSKFKDSVTRRHAELRVPLKGKIDIHQETTQRA